MDCKRDCNWNYDGICCSDELEDRYDEVTGDNNCPLWLRPNFDEYFHDTLDYIRESIKHMNISKLEQIKKFIDSQRNCTNIKSKKLIDRRFEQVYCTNCEHWDKLYISLMNEDINVAPSPCCVCYPYNPEDSVEKINRPQYRDKSKSI